jgi:hypothetical protein
MLLKRQAGAGERHFRICLAYEGIWDVSIALPSQSNYKDCRGGMYLQTRVRRLVFPKCVLSSFVVVEIQCRPLDVDFLRDQRTSAKLLEDAKRDEKFGINVARPDESWNASNPSGILSTLYSSHLISRIESSVLCVVPLGNCRKSRAHTSKLNILTRSYWTQVAENTFSSWCWRHSSHVFHLGAQMFKST